MKKNILFLLVLLAFNGQAQDAYHTNLLDTLNKNFKLPKTVLWALPNTESETFAKAINYGGTTTGTTYTDKAFTEGQKRVLTKSTNPWDAANHYRNTTTIQKGDRCQLVVWLRSDSPNAKVNIFAEHFTTYAKEIFVTVNLTKDWKMYLVPFESTAAYQPNTLTIGLHLAMENQTVEIAGTACINYEKSVFFSQMPVNLENSGYDGIASDAPWRKDADKNIDLLRKANLTVKVTEPNGTAVKDAEVRFEMLQHEFKFGTAVVSNKFNGGSAQDNTYEQKMLDLDGKGHGFNEIVFENDHKWNAWEEHWFSSQAEIAQDMAWLKSKGISVRGHNLVWPAWSYSPSDITAAKTPAYIKSRIRGHLNAILKYPGVGTDCIDWDVLNEISDNNEFANHFAGKNGYVTGRELYSEIYKLADSLAPNTKLYINDYVAIEQGGSAGVNRYKSRIDELLAAAAPVEGIGFQGHFSTSPTGIPRVKEIYDEFWNKYKLEAKVTEYDIAKLTSPDVQAKYMRDILSITFAHPSMKGFLMWGFWDGSHWLGNAPIYNQDWSLKPSGTAFIEQVFTKWWTDNKLNTATNGEAINRGFKGKYKITIKLPNGKILTQNVDLDKDKTLTINTNGSVRTQDLAMDFGLKVSPNPIADSVLKISWNPSFSTENATLQIINSIGAIVYQKQVNLNQNNVEVTDLQSVSGVYFVVLKTEKGSEVKKIVKE